MLESPLKTEQTTLQNDPSEANRSSASQEVARMLHGNWRLIAVFLAACSEPDEFSARHAFLLIQSGFYHSCFLIKSLPHAPPIQSYSFDHPDYREEYIYSSSWLCIYLQFLATFSIRYPNTILTTLFPNTLIRGSLNVRNQILYPYMYNMGIVYRKDGWKLQGWISWEDPLEYQEKIELEMYL